jgi:hypothetical protein
VRKTTSAMTVRAVGRETWETNAIMKVQVGALAFSPLGRF